MAHTIIREDLHNCCITRIIEIARMKKEIADLRYENMKQYSKIRAQQALLRRRKSTCR